VAARELLAILQKQDKISLNPVTFLRGRTLHNSFVIVDEAQNLEAATLKTILTRIGDGSKVVFTGDTDQIDHSYLSKSNNALSVLRSRFAGQHVFGHITLTAGERSVVSDLAADLL
jgi:PhoH-like ATPase